MSGSCPWLDVEEYNEVQLDPPDPRGSMATDHLEEYERRTPPTVRVRYSPIQIYMEEGPGALARAGVEQLDLEAQQVLFLRYRCLLRVREIARQMGVSSRYVHRVVSSSVLVVHEYLSCYDPTFTAVPHGALSQLLDDARHSDGLRKVRQWANKNLPRGLKDRSENRRRRGKARLLARKMTLRRMDAVTADPETLSRTPKPIKGARIVRGKRTTGGLVSGSHRQAGEREAAVRLHESGEYGFRALPAEA